MKSDDDDSRPSTSQDHMRHLQNKYGNCSMHDGRYCFVQPDGTHQFLTIPELTLWAASIVSLPSALLQRWTHEYPGVTCCDSHSSSWCSETYSWGWPLCCQTQQVFWFQTLICCIVGSATKHSQHVALSHNIQCCNVSHVSYSKYGRKYAYFQYRKCDINLFVCFFRILVSHLLTLL